MTFTICCVIGTIVVIVELPTMLACYRNMEGELDVRIPTMVIWGRNDSITPPFVAENFVTAYTMRSWPFWTTAATLHQFSAA